MHDAIVVGSGAAGTFVAHALRGTKTLLLDVGVRSEAAPSLQGNLYDLKQRTPLFDSLIGARFESLHNIDNPYLTPKLKAPFMRYVIARPPGAPAVADEGFNAAVSYATGGLANAWGAQVYRFDDRDLRAFPVRARDLEPYYAAVTREIGISGRDDDLSPYAGPAADLQPPLEMSPLCQEILARYERTRPLFHRRRIVLGMPRLAVLSRSHLGRAACQYDNLEFFQPENPAVYSPRFTLQTMIDKGEVDYVPGHLVETYEEGARGVTVRARRLNDGQVASFECRVLILCLGCLNTARLVLFANHDVDTRLPVLTNASSFSPLVAPHRIGMPLNRRSFSGQLSLAMECEEGRSPVIGMIYANDGLLRSDMLFDFPLDLPGCLAAARYLLPATALLQVYYPDTARPGASLRIDHAGRLHITYEPLAPGTAERALLRTFRRIGYFGSSRLVKYARPGESIHYAGPLPMRARPERPYETDRDGRLFGSKAIFIGDAATFPELPAKNLTLTIMANALRIGAAVRAQLDSTA
jgi:choline dehydrogenase-like flavoprotein